MKKIAVLGLGKVGLLAAHLLDDAGFSVTAVEVKEPRLPLSFPVRCLDLHEAGPLDEDVNVHVAQIESLGQGFSRTEYGGLVWPIVAEFSVE